MNLGVNSKNIFTFKMSFRRLMCRSVFGLGSPFRQSLARISLSRCSLSTSHEYPPKDDHSKAQHQQKHHEPHENEEYGGFHIDPLSKAWHWSAYKTFGTVIFAWIFWRIKEDGQHVFGWGKPHFMDPAYDEPGTEDDDLDYFADSSSSTNSNHLTDNSTKIH